MRRSCCLILSVSMFLAGCGSATPTGAATPRAGTHPGDLARALAGTSLEGHPLSLSALRGSVVVLVFWASWCAPCQAEQPALNAIAQREFGSGVRFLGVSVDVDRSAAWAYVTRYAVPYDSLIDTGQTIVVDYDVAGPPTTFVIDRSGRVSAEVVGEVNADDLGGRIATAIAQH